MDIALGIERLSIAFVPVLLGIILHEVAHGYVASKFGDDTARLQGRLTLNPIPHIDPIGLLLFVVTAVVGPFAFGWAKPVPVNPRQFKKIKNVKTGMLWVSLAGPMANLLIALFCAVVLKLLITFVDASLLIGGVGRFFLMMLQVGVVSNCVLMLINLLPIPPLDGSHILARFLPYPYDHKYMTFARYGMFVLLLLIFTGVLNVVIMYFLEILLNLILTLVGLG